jgi:hypothetical protein
MTPAPVRLRRRELRSACPSSSFIVLRRDDFMGREGRLRNVLPAVPWLSTRRWACSSALLAFRTRKMSIARPLSKCVGHPVMRPHRPFRYVFPPFARWQVGPALRMKWIVDPVVRPRRLASHQQQGFARSVVDEAMANPGPGGKGRKVSGTHRVNKAIYPSLDLALKNVYELLLFLLGMGPRTPISGRQANQVHADLAKTSSIANCPLVAGAFLALRISMTGLRN